MKQLIKYLTIITLLLCGGCTDEELVKVVPGTIGNEEVYTTLHFGYKSPDEVQITTRGTLGVVAESRVQNLFVYLFVGNKCVYTQYFDNYNKQASKDEVNAAEWNCWYVDNMGEDEDPAINKDASNGIVRMKTANITGGTLYMIANIDADMVNISPEKLNTIRTKDEIENLTATLNQEITSRNGYFPMTAIVRDVTIEGGVVKKDNETAVAQLERLDAKINVRIRTAIGNINTEDDGTKQTLKEFIPESWQVVNLPKITYAMPYNSSSPEGRPEADYELNDTATGYFNSSEIGFDGSVTEKITFKDNTSQKDTTVEQTTHLFSFYMLENKESNNKTDNVATYHDRSKRTKDEDSGKYITENDGGIWAYAPEQATYLIIKGQVEMDVDVSSEARTQHLAANVIYYIHLGDFKKDLNNYDILRNTNYTYTITIKGVNNIELEVNTSQAGKAEEVQENESGATGMVYIAKEEIYTFDAHYGQRVYMIDAATIDPANITWYVSTPFSEGVPDKIGDTEIPASKDYKWVQFMINKLDTDSNNKQTYSHKNRNYPGDKENPQNENPERLNLMYIDEFTKFIKEEIYKLNKNQPHAFRKEYDQEWYEWYQKQYNKTDDYMQSVKNDTTQSWWRNRLYVTIFVNEYYYETDPISGSAREGLWKEFVNKPNRIMHILCDNQKSLDEASSSTGSIITIRQRSIQTPYNIDNAELTNAWGCETVDETEESYLWFYQEKDESNFSIPNNGNTSSINGLFNTAKLWGYSSNTKLKWGDYVDYERVNNYIKPGETFPRYWMKDGKAVLRYTSLMRNRDNNGNGNIDADEIRWYIASVEQIYGLYIGDQGLSADAQFYNSKKKALDKDQRYAEGHPLAGFLKLMEHIVSSTKHNNAYAPIVVWAEEGVSISYYRQDIGWGENDGGAQSIRCVRNLGMPDATEGNILDPASNTPTKLIEVTIPSNTQKDSEIIFDLTRVNTKSLRSYPTTHELEPTNEFDEMSRPYRKFKTGKLVDTGDYTSLYNNILMGKSPITDTDYRVPNVREAALMTLYCNGLTNWWDGYIHSISYYSRGNHKSNDATMVTKGKPTWVFGNGQYATMGADASKTRAVCDIPVE